MGRYISTGIVFQYRFSKKKVEQQYERYFWKKQPFSELKQAIIDQLFPDIYDHEEDDDYLYVFLSDSVKVIDIITTMKAYYSLVGMGKEKTKEMERVIERLKGKKVIDIYHIAQERTSFLLYDTELGYSYSYYAYPLLFEGKKCFFSVHASIITIDSSSSKTMTEDVLLSYDFFTDLLRYRMRPDKLADSMIIFLSP